MKDRPIKLTNIIPEGQTYYDRRNVVIYPKGCAFTLTSAMGMGGGDLCSLYM